MSIALQSTLGKINVLMQIAEFDKAKHLKEREHQYCTMNLTTHGIFVIRETEEGWWRESIDFKSDIPKQIEKLKNDSTVACGWVNQQRFHEQGGWHDPS
jgi:hypothetical protein